MHLSQVFRAVTALSFAFCCCSFGETVTNTFSVNQPIPDGQLTGFSDTRVLSFENDQFTSITDLEVTLNIAGGFNGDYYGYLVHDSGFSVLLNRSGRASTNSPGYNDTGFDITLLDSASDLHFYRNSGFSVNGSGQLTGTWAPDGRYANPGNVSENDASTSLLGSFDGLDPNGTWTLFLADVDFGEQGTLVQWGLVISAIPEPSSAGLLALGAVGLMVAALRARRAKS
jgi:subtilisin-like proprotein convertase family protein